MKNNRTTSKRTKEHNLKGGLGYSSMPFTCIILIMGGVFRGTTCFNLCLFFVGIIIVASSSGSVRFDDDSTCMCPQRPIWTDSAYGRDEKSAATNFRKREIEEEIRHYQLILPNSTISLSSIQRFTILKTVAKRNDSCDDNFYAHLTGPVLEELRFYALAETANADGMCEYACMWEPFFVGAYEINVWLTYTNGSGLSEPSLLQPHLNASRQALLRTVGRLKDIGVRVSVLETHPEFRYGVASKLLSSQQFVIRDIQGKKGTLLEEDLCSDSNDVSGFFVRRDVCLSDLNCRRMVSHKKGFHDSLKYIWKPSGCISPIFGSAEEFAEAMPVPRNSTFRILFAGDSLVAEESCATKHFLAGKPFSELDCSKDNREGKVPSKVNIEVDFVSIAGFYNSMYGWKNTFPNRTINSARAVLRYAETRHHDLVIWDDSAHSMEKNDVADVVSAIADTARMFKHILGDRVMFRLLSYAHTMGPSSLILPSAGFYQTNMLLQAPRIELANHKVRGLLSQYGISTYDSSVVLAARPEATRDMLHWARATKGHSLPSGEQCHAYCSGKWLGIFRFEVERDVPTMAFSSMQLLLGAILQHQKQRQNCRAAPILNLDAALELTEEEIMAYRYALLEPRKVLGRGLAADYMTECAALLALYNTPWCHHSNTALQPPGQNNPAFVFIPFSEVTRVASWSPRTIRRSYALPLSSRLDRSKDRSMAYLEHLEASVNRTLSTHSLAIVATHGLEVETPVHRALLSSLVVDKRKQFVVTLEIRIRTQLAGKASKGYLVATQANRSEAVLVDEVVVGDVVLGREPLPKHFLDSFVIIPYFTEASCSDSIVPFWKLREPRPLTYAFVGCVPRPAIRGAGFEMRRIILNHLVDDDRAELINSCDWNVTHGQRPNIQAHVAKSLYSRSDFCFAIGGDSISSVRLFDVLSALCIPIITDGATLLPFPDEIPWRKFVVYHEVRSASDVAEIQRRVNCISLEERAAMRAEISRHVHKVLWNWKGGSKPCPEWMRRAQDESPGALLTKTIALESNHNVLVSEMNMELKQCSSS